MNLVYFVFACHVIIVTSAPYDVARVKRADDINNVQEQQAQQIATLQAKVAAQEAKIGRFYVCL